MWQRHADLLIGGKCYYLYSGMQAVVQSSGLHLSPEYRYTGTQERVVAGGRAASSPFLFVHRELLARTKLDRTFEMSSDTAARLPMVEF
jgi:hypothetical protein